jgi:hypothetical protein
MDKREHQQPTTTVRKTHVAPKSPVEFILSPLDWVEKSGKHWKARCPAHDDHEVSLSVEEGNDGGALFKSFAECRVEEIWGEQ